MKIEKIGDGAEKTPPPTMESVFAPALNERIGKVADPALRTELGQMIVDIEAKGAKLAATRGRKEFEDYKHSVKQFMQKVVNRSFRMEERHGRKKDGKFVIYLMMQKVDEAMETLAQLLLAGQQDSMRIVATLDEVRGMLLDFYL